MAAAQRDAVKVYAQQFCPRDSVLLNAPALSDATVKDHILLNYQRNSVLMAQAAVMG